MADKKTTTQAAEQAALDPPAAVRNDIPLLTEKDIECRVQSVSRAKTGRVGAVLLLYKDARVDMRILDQVFGPGNWQRTHEVINGNLFCNIDIWDAEKRAWVRKQDVGVESNTEKEKGQASDAFKRAGFNVGIGRELYTGPFIYVELADNEFYSEGQNGRKEVLKCYSNTRFTVAHVAYNDRREICELVIADRNGNVRFDMNKRVQGPPQTAQGGQGTTTQGNAQGQGKQAPRGRQGAPAGTPAPQTENGAVCPICGKPITKAEQDYSVRKYTVKKGDTLSAIAAKHGTTYQKIAAYNGIKNPNVIRVGQKIKIPTATAPESFAKGDKAKVLNAVTYDGRSFKTYYDVYDVIEVSGDRVVIGVGSTVTAAVKAANLHKV